MLNKLRKQCEPPCLLSKPKGLIIFLYTLLLFSFDLSALDPEKPLQQYLQRQWGILEGLPSEEILSLAQTSNGYIWIGTARGLIRYDGVTFTPIHPVGLSNKWPSRINAILEDRFRENVVWVASNYGLMQVKNNGLMLYTGKDGSSFNHYVHALYQDRSGSLWFGTYDHYLKRLKNGVFSTFGESFGFEKKKITFSIYEDIQGRLWVNTYNVGVFVGRNNHFEKYKIDPEALKKHSPAWKDFTTYSAYPGKNGILWIGSNIGLIGIRNPGTGNDEIAYFFSADTHLNANSVRSIMEDKYGNLWLGTENGVFRIKFYLSGKWKIENTLEGIVVPNLLEDREENIWLCTYGFGLHQLRDAAFYTLRQPSGVHNYVLCLHQSRNGDIHYSSYDGGLYKFNKSSRTFFRALKIQNNPPLKIYSMADDSRGHLWLGFIRGKGIMKYDGKRLEPGPTLQELHCKYIRYIHIDHRESIWIGTLSGIRKIEKNHIHTFTHANGLASNGVKSIYEDNNHNIWVGTDEGLTQLEGGSLFPQHIKNYLPGSIINDIHEDRKKKGVLWIGTFRDGLIRLEKGKQFSFKDVEGLAHISIFKIMEDRNENLWLSSAQSIMKVGKQELNDYARGNRRRLSISRYGKDDGLKSLVFNYTGNKSAILTPSERLWFNTQKGIAVLNPDKLYHNKYPPPVVIEKAVFNYDRVSPGQEGGTFTGIKDIRFFFTVPTFISVTRIKIKYMLEGYDTDWHSLDFPEPRTAHYENVPPGNYRFRVIAANSSGTWNSTGATFSFTLKPYFYQTLLFKLTEGLLGLLAAAAAYLGLRRYVYIRKLKNRYKNSTLDPQKAEAYLAKLLHLMENETLYRDETITLNTLAETLSIPPRYLSQLVNERLEKNFRDFLNSFRIEEAKVLMGKPELNRSLLEISMDVGFNSKEVFNRAFKKNTGMTPSQYRKEHAPKKK
jgi:ligand-binding sensor domain-containing protein/AraC-like DNA-binding protein